MKCAVCNNKRIKLKYKVKRPDIKKGLEYDIRECKDCGFCWADGPFSTQLLENIYDNHFYLTSQQNSYYESSPILLNAKKRADQLKTSVSSGSLLDVGTGKGYFVKEASEYLDAEGIDLSQYAVDEAKNEGIEVFQGNFMDHDFQKKYDVITLWDVFACFSNPVPTIKRVHKIMSDGGLFVFTVPMIDSPLAKVFGKRWPLMIPPTNMVFFTPKSIKKLVEKCGFSVVNMSYETKWVSVDFIIRKLLKSLGLRSLATKKFPVPKKARIPLKSKDILTVFARKI